MQKDEVMRDLGEQTWGQAVSSNQRTCVTIGNFRGAGRWYRKSSHDRDTNGSLVSLCRWEKELHPEDQAQLEGTGRNGVQVHSCQIRRNR